MTSIASQSSSATICCAVPICAKSPCDQICCWTWVTTAGARPGGAPAEKGEHPSALATGIAPACSTGGSWKQIGGLVHGAEPTQTDPMMHWLWIGWNGGPRHGRGNHLLLPSSHSESRPRHPARVVY